MTTLPIVSLKPGKEFAIQRLHPWIFSGAIAKTEQGISDGDLVEVRSSDGAKVGIGHFGEESIAIRVISFKPTVIDEAFWSAKIRSAIILRKSLGLPQSRATNAYRLVNAEGDNLPGLVIDIYGKCAVIQCHSIGMYRVRELFAKILMCELSSEIETVYCKASPVLESDGATKNTGTYLTGNKINEPIFENGHKFLVDWENGQKTGFFLDQRNNRKLIESFARGRRVLNTFCYTGGFSIYALAHDAISVDSVDSSKSALELLEQNIAINELQTGHKAIQADCLQFLQNIENKYDLIILDPPAFVKQRRALSGGIKGYETINTLALEQIAPGGILFTFSCSQHLTRSLFIETIQKAATRCGRTTRIIHQLHAAPCHPLSIYHPEGEYLKGLVLHVE